MLLRISAILKRSSGHPRQLISGGITVDLTARRTMVDGVSISLTPKEFDLLSLLMSQPDVALSRRRLSDFTIPDLSMTAAGSGLWLISRGSRAIRPWSRRFTLWKI